MNFALDLIVGMVKYSRFSPSGLEGIKIRKLEFEGGKSGLEGIKIRKLEFEGGKSGLEGKD